MQLKNRGSKWIVLHLVVWNCWWYRQLYTFFVKIAIISLVVLFCTKLKCSLMFWSYMKIYDGYWFSFIGMMENDIEAKPYRKLEEEFFFFVRSFKEDIIWYFKRSKILDEIHHLFFFCETNLPRDGNIMKLLSKAPIWIYIIDSLSTRTSCGSTN